MSDVAVTERPFADIPEAACGLKLYRVHRDGGLIACESVFFEKARAGVVRTLLLAHLAGRADVEGAVESHFADVLIDHDGTWEATVALDAKSYSALKNRWMRCKIESEDGR